MTRPGLRRFKAMIAGAAMLISVEPILALGSVDPCAAVDQRPFGMHPAVAFGLADRYAPARAAGVAWTRDPPYVMWQLVDPQRTGDPARMRWAGAARDPSIGKDRPFDFDRGRRDAVKAGLHLMWNIGIEPISEGYLQPGTWKPTDQDAYASFVRAAVRRYPEVEVWQVWNEIDLPATRRLTGFADFYRLTRDAIKEVNPAAVVVLAGSAGSFEYYDRLLADLGGRGVDVFDFHLYSDPLGGALSAGGGYADIEAVARRYRELLDRHGLTATRLWSTENGSFSGAVKVGPEGQEIESTATEADQARDLPKRWIVALASGVEKLFWAWGMTEGFGPWDDDLFDHTGLLYDGHGGPPGAPKLAYWAYWQMTRQLEGCRWRRVSRIQTSVPHARAYRCPLASGGDVVVAWWDTFRVPGWAPGATTEITVPWKGATAISRAAAPSAARGAQVVKPEDAFATATLVPRAGAVTLTLGADPVYVREK